MLQWIKFFLVGIIETSEKGTDTFSSILKLKAKIENAKLPELGKKFATAKLLMKYLYKKTVVTAQEVQKELKVSMPTANAILSDFERL